MFAVKVRFLSVAALSAVLLSACGSAGGEAPVAASSITTAPSSSTASTETDGNTASASVSENFSGGSKAPDGEYRPADEYGPAQNVPKPVEPEGMNVESEEGLREFLNYWKDSVNYGLETGDFSFVVPHISETHIIDVEFFAWTENLYNHGGWQVGGLRSVVLFEEQMIHESSGEYTWRGKLIVDNSTIYYQNDQKHDDNSHTHSEEVIYHAKYEDGRWTLVNILSAR